MSAGKTYWWAKDAAWLDREAVVELGVQFGPGGPLVLVLPAGARPARRRPGVRALVFVVGLAVGCALRPLSDRYCAEVEEVTGFYDRELQTYLAGVHDGRRSTDF